jgi:aryl-alcohol dehydrogenase-like predicted oxidoreductase
VGRDDSEIDRAIQDSVEQSAAALGVARIDVMLTHGAADLTRPGVGPALARLQDAGTIGAFGVSAYDAADIEALLRMPGLAAIQAPVHALDWRLADGGLVARCAERGILFFARSVFCQGLMFLAPDELPPHLRAAAPALRKFREIAAHTGLGIAGLAIGAVRAVAGISSLVIGAERPEQIADFSAAARAALPDAATLAALRDLAASISHDLINPRRWPKSAS